MIRGVRAPSGRRRRVAGNTGMLVVGWLLLFGVLFWIASTWLDRGVHPNRQVTASVSGEVVLKRNRAGHYVADGEINGEKVTFLIDTGATQIAIPADLARRLALKLGPPVQLQTAAGPAPGYPTRLASVRVAGLEMKDVAALVAEGMEPGMVLLGMNFLKRVELTQRGDLLILRPLN